MGASVRRMRDSDREEVPEVTKQPTTPSTGEAIPAWRLCPACRSAKVRCRKKDRMMVCDRCGNEWPRPVVVDENQGSLL